MTQEAKFKYTFPITKAEQRSDGYYITGYASGPEVDSEGERMDPEAIVRFANQINDDTADHLMYRDAHAPDGVLRDLGEITKAWVESNFHLGIEVKLEDDNPSSMYLFRQLKKGKQYGMSVAGHVVDYAMEFVEEIGKSVLTYKNVVLDEISNTTRPAWYPSFGNVLAKSIRDASDASGETTLGKTNEDLLDTGVEDATNKSDDGDATVTDETQKAADESAETTDKSETTEDDGADSTEKSETEEDADVEKSGRRVNNQTSAKLLGLYTEMGAALTALGVLEAPTTEETESEKSASESEEDTTEKTEGDDATADVISKSDFDVLAAALVKATERIAELEARPATQMPGVITDATKAAAEAEMADILSKASPSEKMRLAFAAHTSGK